MYEEGCGESTYLGRMTTTKAMTTAPLTPISPPPSLPMSWGVGGCETFVGTCTLTTSMRPASMRRSTSGTIIGAVVLRVGGRGRRGGVVGLRGDSRSHCLSVVKYYYVSVDGDAVGFRDTTKGDLLHLTKYYADATTLLFQPSDVWRCNVYMTAMFCDFDKACLHEERCSK